MSILKFGAMASKETRCLTQNSAAFLI